MSDATLVFVAARSAFAPLVEALNDYRIIHFRSRGNYISALVDARAAMVFVDSAMPAWRDFVTAPKASAATRRIPLLLVSDEASIRADAIVAGADLALSWTELKRDCRALVDAHGRLTDAETLARLGCECQESLPARAIEGIRLFNAGLYYEQHDLFEALWNDRAGPVRDLYRAILQVGIAYYHIEKGNYRGALKMLQRSVQWLQILPEVCQGVDVAGLRRDSYALRALLENRDEAKIAELAPGFIKPVRLTPPEN